MFKQYCYLLFSNSSANIINKDAPGPQAGGFPRPDQHYDYIIRARVSMLLSLVVVVVIIILMILLVM